MNCRSTYYRYRYDDDWVRPEWETEGYYRSPFIGWLGEESEFARALPWVGGAAIALGLLILLFPMLLVVAVSAVFFMAGAACLALWWQVRQAGRGIHREADWIPRLKRWFRERVG